MRFGINLWGVWDQLSADPEGFCRTVRGYGYRYLEPCIVIGKGIEGLPQFLEEDALAALLKTAGEFGIQAECAHVAVTDEANAGLIMARYAKTYGIRRFVLKSPTEYTEEAFAACAKQLVAYADAVKEAGAEILLHNEGGDIAAKLGGKTAYEYLLDACGGKVYAEPDVGWMLYGGGNGAGGKDPEAFLWNNKAAVHALHYKDFLATEDGWKQCAIGDGAVDVGAVFRFARAAEVIQYVDQDESDDMMRDLKLAAERLNALQFSWGETRSTLCIFDTESDKVQELKTYDYVIEAPNWLKDGDTLVFNTDGRLVRHSISTGEEAFIDTGYCTNCNNDHVIAFDQTQVAVSHSEADGISRIYTLPLAGGTPTLVTENGPSYLHGWSPDGETLAFCGFRKYDGAQDWSVDVVTIPAKGGKETRLTCEGFNDGPEYSDDGKKIWFISTRTGLMQVWRMNADGSCQEQMTFEEQNNWFGHISPDCKKVVNIAYSKDGLDANQHLPNMEVSLWLMNEDGTDRKKILDFFGGQGSINVNSWSPDSRYFAFVRYELLHK